MKYLAQQRAMKGVKMSGIFELRRSAIGIRKNILRMIAANGRGHIGGSLSIADLLAVLFHGEMNIDSKKPQMKERDMLVLSKGHAGPAVYAALCQAGYFSEGELATLNQNGTRLPSHPDRLKTPGVDVSTGSLGQGASLAAGIAFANKLDSLFSYTYLILGDGELNEGQVWECLMFAAQQNLTNLITFVDANGKQLDGLTCDICRMDNLAERFRAFGYHVVDVENGNDVVQIQAAIKKAKREREVPSIIVLHTTKGAGIKRYEEMENCHSVALSNEEYLECIEELEKAERALEDVHG